MADLVTHLAAVLLPAAVLPDRRWAVPLAMGAVLPDLLSRVPSLALEFVDRFLAVPEVVFWPWGAMHEPIGVGLAVAVLAGRFATDQRRWVAGALLAGAASHVLLDVMQDHHGQGYFLLAPFSVRRFELGWVGAQDTVHVALPLGIAAALAWMARWRLGSRLLWLGAGVPLARADGRVQVERVGINALPRVRDDLARLFGEPVHMERGPLGVDECLGARRVSLPEVAVPTRISFSFPEAEDAHTSLGRGLAGLLLSWRVNGHPGAWTVTDLGPANGYRIVQTEWQPEPGRLQAWVSPLGEPVTLEPMWLSVDGHIDRVLVKLGLGDSREVTGLWDPREGMQVLGADREVARDVVLRAARAVDPQGYYSFVSTCWSGDVLAVHRVDAGPWVIDGDGELVRPPP